MSLPKFTPHMISNQPDQTAYLLNKLVQEGVGGTGGGGGDIHLYPGTGQHTDGAMTQKATTDALGLKADSSTVSAQLANKVDKEVGKGLSSNDFTDEDQTKLANIPTNIMTTDTAQTVTGTKTFHNAEIATDNMITLKNNSTSLIRGMAGIEYRQLLKRGSTDVEVGNTHDPLALKGSGTRPKYNSNDLALYSDVPAAQVQSDWDQADNTAVDYIKNKPTIPGPLPDNLVYHDDPSTVVPTVPYVNTGDIVNGAVTSDKMDLSTLVTDWVTVASGTSWSVEYQKFGPIVFVRGHSQGDVSIPANSTYNSIATLPVGCRPSKQVLGFVSLQGGTQSASRYYRIAPEGIVSIYNRNNGVDTSFSYWEFYSVFLAN